MNIVLTSYYYKPHIGGVENSLYNIAIVLQKMGHSVTIIASDAGLKKKERLLSSEIIDKIQVIRFKRFIPILPLFFFLGPITDLIRSFLLFKKVKRKQNIQLVLSRNHITCLGAKMARIGPIFYCLPGIIKFQGDVGFSISNIQNVKEKFLQLYVKIFVLSQLHLIQKQALERADKIIVFSENMKNQIRSVTIKKSLIIKKIFPGVDIKRFASIEKSRAEFGLKEKDFIFLCLGRIIAAKGFDIAIQALGEMNHKNVKLMIVGNGPEIKNLINLAESLKISEKVLFFPGTDHPEKFYSAANVFLMTSHHETFGQTIIEAMASGLPVIAFDSHQDQIMTASSEIIENGKNGILCKYGIDALKDAMDKTIEFPDLEKIKYLNIKKAEEYFSWEHFVNEVINEAK